MSSSSTSSSVDHVPRDPVPFACCWTRSEIVDALVQAGLVRHVQRSRVLRSNATNDDLMRQLVDAGFHPPRTKAMDVLPVVPAATTKTSSICALSSLSMLTSRHGRVYACDSTSVYALDTTACLQFADSFPIMVGDHNARPSDAQSAPSIHAHLLTERALEHQILQQIKQHDEDSFDAKQSKGNATHLSTACLLVVDSAHNALGSAHSAHGNALGVHGGQQAQTQRRGDELIWNTSDGLMSVVVPSDSVLTLPDPPRLLAEEIEVWPRLPNWPLADVKRVLFAHIRGMAADPVRGSAVLFLIVYLPPTPSSEEQFEVVRWNRLRKRVDRVDVYKDDSRAQRLARYDSIVVDRGSRLYVSDPGHACVTSLSVTTNSADGSVMCGPRTVFGVWSQVALGPVRVERTQRSQIHRAQGAAGAAQGASGAMHEATEEEKQEHAIRQLRIQESMALHSIQDDGCSPAITRFGHPRGLFCCSDDSILVADTAMRVIRRIRPVESPDVNHNGRSHRSFVVDTLRNDRAQPIELPWHPHQMTMLRDGSLLVSEAAPMPGVKPRCVQLRPWSPFLESAAVIFLLANHANDGRVPDLLPEDAMMIARFRAAEQCMHAEMYETGTSAQQATEQTRAVFYQVVDRLRFQLECSRAQQQATRDVVASSTPSAPSGAAPSSDSSSGGRVDATDGVDHVNPVQLERSELVELDRATASTEYEPYGWTNLRVV